ncbi:DUF4198 domain-containing protein [Cytophaga hutchinsonii]|uniref:Uncharacterized protein n=1 Tax=Cytophaga hutchinsonii (strain ATCC 33406 / DSM 1761 / CIP 103989 / NBRC 15051 / NCIMB 9469 / D465) TaxID=269798 RepID=A0A6N4SMR3_CYTH3|nr:DUF4198 domain-containing protein [Cytophaga hutchinsonii]ABG57555.1 conserved hypothetical protein [Cytophaga hutchinsonii ATCC 33406]SFW99830.1 hypothetical protein SAMN04487930_101117 [Cytophaga hutchinsonii ATCC 33406]
MIKSLTLFVVSLLLLNTGNAFAHALWIETAATGKIGQKQQVAVYYGEYAEGEKDSVSHWYSDVKDVKLWLVGPDNKKVQLTTTAEAARLVADFTPAANGIYTLLADHPVKDVARTTLYQFVSSATVTVGTAATPSVTANTNSLSLTARSGYKVDKPVTVDALFKNKPNTDITYSVVTPAGWSKSFKSDANGNLTFTPAAAGVYYVEAFYTEKITGEQNGKAYESIWRGATYLITVTK